MKTCLTEFIAFKKRANKASHHVEETAAEECLRNTLVLQKIFSYLPTNILLSSCSLVNKTWNTEARLFVRDNRTCFLESIEYWRKSLCQLLQELNHLLEKIVEDRRVVPWNAMKVQLSKRDYECHNSIQLNEEMQLRNISRHLKLKHLTFIQLAVGSRSTGCLTHIPFVALLSQASGQLQRLDIWSMDSNVAQALASPWQPNFPVLQEITVRFVYVRGGGHSQIKEFLRRTMDGAPKLEKIIVGEPEVLQCIPEERYHLLRSLKLDNMSGQDEVLFQRIINARPLLTALEIHQEYPHSNYANVPPDADHVDQEWKFGSVLEKFLQTCHESLKLLKIHGIYPLHQLSPSPLINLTELKMDVRRQLTSEFDSFWDSIIRIDFSSKMPNLREMEITMCTGDGARHDYSEESWGTREWPAHGCHTVSPCVGLRKLILALEVARINMSLLKSVFPGVTALELRINDSRHTKADPAPFSQIAEAWPGLQRLKISGWKNVLLRSYDSDVLGISEEELKVLRGMDFNCLEAVQVVPVRPSVATMSSLRELSVNLWFCSGFGDPVVFISKMAQTLAFERVHHLNASISCAYRSYDEGQCNDVNAYDNRDPEDGHVSGDRDANCNHGTRMAFRLKRVLSNFLCCNRQPAEQ